MAMATTTEPLNLRVASNGTVYVGDTRVPIDLVIYAYLEGSSAEEIAEGYDALDPGDVHTVLGYYLRHTDEVHEYLQERRRYADERWAKIEEWQRGIRLDPAEFRERLLARTSSKSNGQ